MTTKDFSAAYKDIFEGMRTNLMKSSGPGLLKEYSPWLHAFHTNNSYTETIEVPGKC